MTRRIGALAAVVIAASALVASPAAAQDPELFDVPATAVRIQARKVESGKVEFGLRLEGGHEWLPRARLFPYTTAQVGRWLFAPPYAMSDGAMVRIQARLLANGKLEFGLQVDGDQLWLPRARFFPYPTAQVGRWLLSSAYTAGDAVATEPATPPSATRNLRVAAVICDEWGYPHSIRLSWDPPGNSGSSTISGYSVTRLRVPQPDRDLRAEFGDWVSSWVRGAPSISDPGVDRVVTARSFTDSQVFLDELYEWSVRAITDTGQGRPARVRLSYVTDYSYYRPRPQDVFRSDCDELAEPLPGASPPRPPQGLSAQWRDDGPLTEGIYLTWSPPVNDGGDRITSYAVHGPADRDSRFAVGYRILPVARGAQSAFVYLHHGIPWEAGKTYDFTVAAANSHGEGPSVATSLTANGPGKPTDLRLRVTCDSQDNPQEMRLEWESPQSDRGSPLSSYVAHVNAEEEGPLITAKGWSSYTSNTYWDFWSRGSGSSFLENIAVLSFFVRAKNANGLSGEGTLRVELDSNLCS